MVGISDMFEQYSKYTGTGIFMVLFFVCLVYMSVSDKDKGNRTVLLHGSIWIVIVIFLPLLYFLYVNLVDANTYWRMWWLVPMGIGLAYVGTNLIKDHRIMGFIIVGLMMILGGRFVYTSDFYFMRSENMYQIPQVVIELDDAIEEHEATSKMAAFPAELLIYVRQYDVNIKMPYGREQLDTTWIANSDFYLETVKDEYDFEVLHDYCVSTGTVYFVTNTYRPYANAPEDYGFEYMTAVGNYEIYTLPELWRN